MPRGTRTPTSAFIIIPKDLSYPNWKIEITSDGTTRDVSDYITNGTITRIATEGLSTFAFEVDNNAGRYQDVFEAGDVLDIYYDQGDGATPTLTKVRHRFYVDGAYDNFNGGAGLFISLEGRDAPNSDNHEHFADTNVTLQFATKNNLDCWLGEGATTDAQGNSNGGVLYNSGMIMKVYDDRISKWRVYSEMSEEEKLDLKNQDGYTTTHLRTYVDKSRLTISKDLAIEGDYDFRIEYDSDSGNTYFMVHPEDGIINRKEYVSAKENLISLSRFGKDTMEEYNRIKEKGFTDGSLILMNTREDTDRQGVLWIKDKEETTSELLTNAEVIEKANARLTELKEAKKRGAIVAVGLPTLQPAEKIPIFIPYVIRDYLKVKSFTLNFGADGLTTNLNLQNRETDFARIFKDRIDENVNVTPTDNPNGMENGELYDFATGVYTLSNCTITDGVLLLTSGQTTGTCVTAVRAIVGGASSAEIRIQANQFENCTYAISGDGVDWEEVPLTQLTTIASGSTWDNLYLRITLNLSTDSISPQFNKVDVLYK